MRRRMAYFILPLSVLLRHIYAHTQLYQLCTLLRSFVPGQEIGGFAPDYAESIIVRTVDFFNRLGQLICSYGQRFRMDSHWLPLFNYSSHASLKTLLYEEERRKNAAFLPILY